MSCREPFVGSMPVSLLSAIYGQESKRSLFWQSLMFALGVKNYYLQGDEKNSASLCAWLLQALNFMDRLIGIGLG
jgi:hypothetical protein